MLINILGKRWKIVWKSSKEIGANKYGECDPPSKKGKEIRIYKGLKGEQRLEVLIHEMLHAADWSKDESWVNDTSKDIARVLTRLGYKEGSVSND